MICRICGISEKRDDAHRCMLFFYERTGCGALFRPKTGVCCVFCSYGLVACPLVQRMAAP
jgi:hypothetical protein